MSEPSRFSFSAVLVHHIDGPDTAEIYFRKENDGLFVRHDDYARLKAEVERLRKAGDDLYKSMLEIGCNEMADNFQYDAWWGSMRSWQSAKEGKQP